MTAARRLSLRLRPSQLPGDDGERSDGAAGLQLQGRQEAVRGLAGAQSLQGLAQPAPRFMGRAVDLNGITQDLLPEVDVAPSHQQSALGAETRGSELFASLSFQFYNVSGQNPNSVGRRQQFSGSMIHDPSMNGCLFQLPRQPKQLRLSEVIARHITHTYYSTRHLHSDDNFPANTITIHSYYNRNTKRKKKHK